jgi:hypothetical protein
MTTFTDYKGMHVRKTAGDPDDPAAVWFQDHVTGQMSLKPFAGATFLDELSQATDEAPEHLIIATDYVEREPWIEQVGLDRKIVPAGPPDDPMQQVHNFPECDVLLLHMIQGDYRYRVVQQPGRQADDQVAHYYLADLESVQEPTGHDTSTGWRRISGPGRAAEYVSMSAGGQG